MKNEERRGSALLIVLGMMAFMVVSAVAFSIYMRQSRLPSSYLRQRLAASQLVKAGLAGAMQRIDAAIADNPYPGIGLQGVRQVEFKKNDGERQTVRYGNYWRNRVFLESELAQTGSLGGDDAELDFDTVSTLTLEALAYIPPPLVNTVRIWSRRTSTASWQSLGYDAGRYAFTAVNVSDYFDVNRVRAGVMRDSTPGNRISMGYLFENDNHTDDGQNASPKAFDDFIAQVTNDVFKTRLVSLADYNVALGSGSYGDVGFASPFWNYLGSGTRPGDGTFYGGAADSAKRQKFVTDSWFPGRGNGGTAETFLTDAEGQAFDGKDQSLDELQKTEGSEAYKILRERIDLCALGALYDYVDEDSVPISLAIPTLEHVPMLTGIRLTPSGFKVELDSKETTEQKGTEENPETWVRKAWWVKSLGTDPKVTVSTCFAYPFARKSNLSRASSYKLQVLVRGFLCKNEEDFSKTRLETGLKPGKGDWKADLALTAPDKAYVSLFEGTKTVQVSEGTDEGHCAVDVSDIALSIDADALQKPWVYGLYYRQKQDGSVDDATCAYDASGENLGLAPNQNKLLYRDIANKRGAEVGDGTKLKIGFAVWLRVLDGNDNTVDLVPAMLSDDQEYNGHNSGDMGGDAPKVCGSTEPVIPHATGVVLDLSKDRFKNTNGAQDPAELGDLAILCDDPRFNYAPEDWYVAENGNISPDAWRAAAKNRCNGSGRRPNDFFQFVSDIGYMQSMGELQFLPYLAPFKTSSGGVPNGGFYNAAKYNGAPFSSRTGAGSCANKDYAWQTHWAFGANRSRTDEADGEESDPYDWGLCDSNGGMAVSPYADEDLMMGAIANTPYDWIMASGEDGLTLKDGRKYCFGPDSSEARVEWDELRKVATGIKNLVGTETDWEEKLFYSTEAGRQWDDDNGPFGADFGDNFHDVDRKYLYGYWRSCFANRQQLFLIFVRAEPAVMGGSSAGHTPSQLGARAVALVWREPESSIDDNVNSGGSASKPHRMRILFYHQFE